MRRAGVLAAGAVIHCYHHEHDIFRMGGLRNRLPIAFWSFVIGSAALAAVIGDKPMPRTEVTK